ncbi:terminase small subunit [Rhizobium leguminosarum]|uniref:terminase small subunit n=1 Tax=Rhizobium leguminosarum TaxID=384 RepID=UPI003F98154F
MKRRIHQPVLQRFCYPVNSLPQPSPTIVATSSRARSPTAELTPRQRLFGAEYLTDLNAKQAVARAGFTGKSNRTPSRLMANEAVRAGD